MNVSHKATKAAYVVARRVYEGRTDRESGLDLLTTRHSMNRNSAAAHLAIFACMHQARRYTRTNNAYATDHYLSRIRADYGEDGLRKALATVALHIEYYENLRRARLGRIRGIHSKHSALLDHDALVIYADEIAEGETYREGTVTQRYINAYERNPAARKQCIEHYGCNCLVCGFDFHEVYGEIGRSFIHVHHLLELSKIKKRYVVDPITDLRPVCPNCHAMIHQQKPAMSIEDLRHRITNAYRRRARVRRKRPS